MTDLHVVLFVHVVNSVAIHFFLSFHKQVSKTMTASSLPPTGRQPSCCLFKRKQTVSKPWFQSVENLANKMCLSGLNSRSVHCVCVTKLRINFISLWRCVNCFQQGQFGKTFEITELARAFGVFRAWRVQVLGKRWHCQAKPLQYKHF